MVVPTTGGIVLVPFPFSDLSQAKLRPAVVLAAADRGDWILCQMTSNPYGDRRAVMITASGIRSGTLRGTDYARPGKLFTASGHLLVSQVAQVRREVFEEITNAVIRLLRQGLARSS